MAKKQTTTKTATPKAKYYIVMDRDQDIIAQGEWDDIKDALENYMDDEPGDRVFIEEELTIHELSAGKKLKYIPHVPASVSL